MSATQEQLGQVSRQLTAGQRDGRPTRVLVTSQTYDTDLADLWEAVTSAERISRWFVPVSGDLRLGGRYQVEGNAGGEVLECDPPQSFTVTWEFGGEVSWVEVRLRAEDGGDAGRSTLELRHTAQVGDERWRQFGPGAVGIGWDMTLLGLAQHLSGRVTVDPAAAVTWMVSDDGHRFITTSGRQWQAVAVAAGEDPDQAAAAAGRCIDAYTGQAPAES